ncbi:hypothetical protein FRC12_023194 [Ceratobasidium sp. 428]|nr:hypothetical protein FRC12_023194 [Ceratobasidium sp. 428]
MSNAPNERLPKLVAFDLDYTLWDFWVDTHVSPPFKRNGNSINQATDRYKTPISFYKDVPAILQHLVDKECHVAACSRTSATDEYVLGDGVTGVGGPVPTAAPDRRS